MQAVFYRKYIPLILTATAALFMILDYYLDTTVGIGIGVKAIADHFREATSTITLFAVFLAIIVLCRQNLIQAGRAKTLVDRFLAVEMLVLVVFSVLLGLYLGIDSRDFGIYLEITLQAATVATVITGNFWTFYGAYRALRLRSLDSAALLLSSLVVLAGYAPWGRMTIPALGTLSTWMMNNINKSVARGITIGAGIGAASAAFRTIIGRERAFIRGD